MGVGVQSFFSIREFVARARDVDVNKCWPFGGREDGEERMLPDMVWRKHRWWASELGALRSARRDLGRGGFSGAEKGEGGDRVVEEETDEGVVCVGNVTRAPKKRSIVELFAVAPQIEGGGEEQDHDRTVVAGPKKSRREDLVEVLTWKKKNNNNSNKKKEEEVVDKTTTTTKKKARKNWGNNSSRKVTSIRKKQQQIRRMPSDHKTVAERKAGKLRLKNKDKAHKINLVSGVDISQLVLGPVIKTCRSEGAIQHVKRKPAVTTILPKKKKQKITETTKTSLNKEHGKSTFSILGILKNHRRFTSSEKNASINLQNSEFDKDQHVQHGKRHVSFSEEDDILGPKDKNFPLKPSPVQNLCGVFSDALTISEIPENLSKDGKEACATYESKDVADDARTITHADKTLKTSNYPTELHESNCSATTVMGGPNGHPTSQQMEKNTFVNSVDLNHSLQAHNDLDLLELCTCPAPSDLMYSGGSVQLAKLGINSASYPRMEGGYSSKYVSDYVSKTSTISSISSITGSNSKQSFPSSSVIKGTDEHSNQWIDARKHAFNLAPQLNQVDNVSNDAMLSCQQSAVDFNKSHQNNLECGGSSVQCDPLAIYHQKYADENFFGLPLNSKGELINLDSHGILEKIGLLDSQNSIRGFSMPNQFEPMQRVDHHKKNDCSTIDLHGKEKNLLPWQSLFKNQPSRSYQSVVNIYPEYPVMDINSTHHDLGQERDCLPYQRYFEQRKCCFLCREHDVQKTSVFNGFSDCASQSANQPMMRLMGKIVTVGKPCKECQCLEDGMVCVDKEAIAEQNPVVRIPDKSLENWQSQKGLFAHSASESSQRSFVHPPDTTFCHNMFDFYQKDCMANRTQHSHIDNSPHWHQRNRPINGSHHLRVGSFIQPQTNVLLNDISKQPVTCISGTESTKMFSQVPSVSSVPFSSCQQMLPMNGRLSQNSSSALHHSFLNMDYGHHIRHEVPSQNLQQWVIDAANHRTSPNASSYSKPAFDYHLHTISKVNLNHFSCPYAPLVGSFHDQVASRKCLRNLSMTSPIDSSLVTGFPVVGASCQGDLKNRDASKSWFTYVDEHDQAKKMRKRSPSNSIDIMKPTNRSSLVLLDDSDDLTVSRKTDPLHGCTQYTSAAPGFCSHLDKTTKLNNNEKDVCPISSRSDFPQLDNGLRSVPIKLSAGTKHILKPNQNVDVDNCRSIYSSVPIAVGGDTGKVPLPQKKSAKIYQF